MNWEAYNHKLTMHFLWYQYFQLFSLFVAIFCYRGLNKFLIASFIPILLLDNIIEGIGINYSSFGWANNYFIYNLYLVISTPLFLYLYSQMLYLKKKEVRTFWSAAFVCQLLILINYYYIQGPGNFNTFSLLLIEILNVVISCLILIRMTVQNDKEIAFFREPYFWISAVILLFSLVTLILLGLQKYISVNHIEIGHKSLYYAIMPAANAVLYSGYCYAFILCQKQTNRS